MIGLDTNVLVRYLVQDDKRQSALAIKIIESPGEVFWVNLIVLCELAWVLESCYHLPKKKIAETIEKILITRQFSIERSDWVWESLDDFNMSNADFSDALIGRINIHHDCQTTLTFDKSTQKLKTFKVVG